MTEPDESSASVPDRAPPTFLVHALHGPPRPVLVLAVTGEIDRTNDAELIATARDATDVARGPAPLPTGRFGCRRVARTLVVDLRGATFVGARALGLLTALRDGAGERVRLVVPRESVVRRALAVVGPPPACPVYADLADAVLGEVDPTEHAVD